MPYIRNCELRADISMPEGMNRVALGLEYNGETFNGFQKQRHTPDTVQHRLEVALSRVANEAVTLVCAGRTDSGVHASGQVVHFDTLAERPGKAWVQGVNALLPDAIRVHWSKVVVPEFHARFGAKARTYRYIFFCSPVRSAVLSRGVTWVSSSLDFQKMESAAKHLIGEYDFSSFRSSQCQASHAVREVKNIRFFKSGQFRVMEIKANAFLHHMVRNIVGALLEVGLGRKSPDWLLEHRERRDRSLGPPTGPAEGLYLVNVDYSDEFLLPRVKTGPCFINE